MKTKNPPLLTAIYAVPFRDFDYVPLAKACGVVEVVHSELKLTVRGTRESIDRLSRDLDFPPESVE